MKKTRRASFLLALVLLLGMVPGLVSASDYSESLPKYGYNYTVSSTFEAGSIVVFGSYPQSSEEPEPIEWIVASVEDGKAFLISRFCLDSRPFHDSDLRISFEESASAAWLNDEFMNTAFTAEEQARLNTTAAGTLVCIPSFKELRKMEQQLRYGFPTAYALEQGAVDRGNGACRYWLRDEGISERYRLYIDPFGQPFENGMRIDAENIAIRPAILVTVEG